MGLNASLSLFSLTILLVFSKVVTADNITLAFEKYSNFSTMSNLFTQTKLTVPISKYQTITVLAVSNDAISSITNRSDVELKNILMTHVILDYYDELKLQGMREKSIMLTTLYQTTGLGEEMNGFLNVTKLEGRVYFGSAVKNSPLNAEYVSTVYHNPYNLSIIEISMPIVAPGLSLAVLPPPPPPVPIVPSPSPSPIDASMVPAPSPMVNATTAPGPAADASDTVVPKTTPTTDTPEADSPAPAPTADNEKIEAADKAKPSSSACKAGSRFELILLLAFFASFAGF
ncbi:PREDICTED: fasciclin-like arabinogalactan protein 5 [Camelina sativa]|uniref:Fasciclin-like arabinogalactan protein 5 n=1 Tax=Camelina sativa TaxID=90675 RepID=A0ABM0TXH7_CAMSA|nr:PREDICTED: fasciclin-like arabinogalactan protein 5 [Camelina sativa]